MKLFYLCHNFESQNFTKQYAYVSGVKPIFLCHIFIHCSLTLCAKFDGTLSAKFEVTMIKFLAYFFGHGYVIFSKELYYHSSELQNLFQF